MVKLIIRKFHIFREIENGAGAASADVPPMTRVDSGEPASEQEGKCAQPPGGETDNSGETTVINEPASTGGAQMPDNVNLIKMKDGGNCQSGY